MDFFFLLYLNNELGRSIPFGFEAVCKVLLGMLFPELQNELVTETGSIPSVQAFLVKTKVWTWAFIWRKKLPKKSKY